MTEQEFIAAAEAKGFEIQAGALADDRANGVVWDFTDAAKKVENFNYEAYFAWVEERRAEILEGA